MSNSDAILLLLLLFLSGCFLVHLVTLFTGNRQTDHKGHKFFKVHFSIPIGVQITHHLVNGGWVFLRLHRERKFRGKKGKKWYSNNKSAKNKKKKLQAHGLVWGKIYVKCLSYRVKYKTKYKTYKISKHY